MAKSHWSLQLSRSKDTILESDKSLTSMPATRGNMFTRPGQYLRTPIRRFFFRFEVRKSNPTGVGGKRPRSDKRRGFDYGRGRKAMANNTPPLSSDIASSPIAELDSPTSVHRSRSPFPHRTPPVPCVALQNSDHSIDAVVISTLLKLPFCCHEDLLTMKPTRVFEVAKEMNDRLPEALQIDLSQSRNYKDVRNEVERLVGIVKKASEVQVPGAPLKRVRSRGGRRDSGKKDSDFDALNELDLRAISPPTSPLAVISATRGNRRRDGETTDVSMVISPTKLTMLREEDEDDEMESMEETAVIDSEKRRTGVNEDFFRAIKKRKTSASFDNTTEEDTEMITPTMHRIKVPLMLKKMYDANETSPTPHRILRVRSQRKVVFDQPSFDTSFLKENNVVVKTTVVDRSLVNTRPRYRSAAKFSNSRAAGPLQTSTPKVTQRRYGRRNNTRSPSNVRSDDSRSFSSPVSIDTATPPTTGVHSHLAAMRARDQDSSSSSPEWNFVDSRIPRYRRRPSKRRESKSAFAQVNDLVMFDFEGTKDDRDTNKTV
ncbi:hypothetical protein AGABI2DRAFT_180981 [Agaricus bisporus var. bisporus H97]|uniref:hypothetical protein n=1 Tax=Agaricus bisporus var. bisporus (strain H97 / ATCC MYA-4626 / FGSC 10389) TaxID=936046 RepID=UPI00029F64AA|nr:hypothetical protein AGABI2DRAFT_180981 [Agaricus bisporus var. bisporus H97]EKV43314.1 hypothetical protein AGABI2DRAFT_180981 [Agaricus bisporus var. bisporus H97]